MTLPQETAEHAPATSECAPSQSRWTRFLLGCRNWLYGRPRFLSGRELVDAVLSLIENCDKEEEIVLASGYIHVWPELERALREAIKDRQAKVQCITRRPDGRGHERTKQEEASAALESIGVKVHLVDRYHGKVYLSERQAIIGSLNLVGASQSSIEFGVQFRSRAVAQKCRKELARYCPELDKGLLHLLIEFVRPKRKASPPRPEATPTEVSTNQDRAFCIGCGRDRSYCKGYWLCSRCYKELQANDGDITVFKNRRCYKCGSPNPSTRKAPFCPTCT